VNQTSKLLFALIQVEGISKLMKDNEYEQYFTSFLTPIHVELSRQLTNLKQSSKMEK
jgi:hypothetical protein